MYWNSQYFSNGSGLSCNVCPAHLQFAEGDDGSQIRVSILSPRADISLETGAGNTLVKRKKCGFQNLSGQKSDNKSGAPTNLKHLTLQESSVASSMRDNDESLREEAVKMRISRLHQETSSPSFSGQKRRFHV